MAKDSYAEQWAISHNVKYVVRSISDSPTENIFEDMESADVAASLERGSATVSGFCGSELTWSLENKVLTISGEGEMDSYRLDVAAPWAEYVDEIECVVIGRDVKRIGAYAFNGLDKMNAVIFEYDSELMVIEDYAFANCKELTDIELPDGLETLGEGAFANCEKLSKVVLPESVSAFSSVTVDFQWLEDFIDREPVAVFEGCDMTILVLVVTSGSSAEQYAMENGISVQYNETAVLLESDAIVQTELFEDEGMLNTASEQ